MIEESILASEKKSGAITLSSSIFQRLQPYFNLTLPFATAG
jgi:hypothetical protein